MAKRGGHRNLSTKARSAASRGRRAQHLERDDLTLASITSTIHDRHASASDLTFDFVLVGDGGTKAGVVAVLFPERRKPRSSRLLEKARGRFRALRLVDGQLLSETC